MSRHAWDEQILAYEERAATEKDPHYIWIMKGCRRPEKSDVNGSRGVRLEGQQQQVRQNRL